MPAVDHPSQMPILTEVAAAACTFCGRPVDGPLATQIVVDDEPHPFCCADHGILWTTSLRHQITRYP